MIARIFAVAANTYREAVRGRALHALLALALASCIYSVLVASLSLHEERRVVADIGAASISLGAVMVAIVLGSTSLHREIEHKTIFPMLTRALRRHEWLVGKYLGTLLTLAVFIGLHGAVVLGLLAAAGQSLVLAATTATVLLAALVTIALRAPRARTYAVIPWTCVCFIAMASINAIHTGATSGVSGAPSASLVGAAGGELRLVLASSALALSEAAIVAALTTFFSSFSSPALTAVFTVGVFVIGRSVDTLGHLPVRVVGPIFRAAGKILAYVVPNLHLYVPPRPLLLGQLPETPVWPFVASAAQNALLYAALLVTLSAILFQRRDFQ